ncbi:MAG: 50S ribosomal protein L28 [Bacteroidia bacterium]|jgi:large subunit ribosomal protein L28|nr:50S ribosomal protein L28 [Bacteroidia bacterium]
MSKICQLTGKSVIVGNSVSFSNRKTRRKFNPNLQLKKFFIPETGEWVRLKVSTSAIKNINKKGIYKCLVDAVNQGHLS